MYTEPIIHPHNPWWMLHAKYLKGPKCFNILRKKSNDKEIGYLKKSALSSKQLLLKDKYCKSNQGVKDHLTIASQNQKP